MEQRRTFRVYRTGEVLDVWNKSSGHRYEVEEENERFKEKQSKAEEIMKNGELSKITKQDMYYYLTNCGYLEKEIEHR